VTSLLELDLDLSDVDLGGIDAESDHNLSEYFLRTEWATKSVSGKRTHVIGRKGSGKSAIFAQLTAIDDGHNLVELVTPDQYSWAALRAYKEEVLSTEQAYKNAWSYTLAAVIALALDGGGVEYSQEARQSFNAAHQFIGDNFSGGRIAPVTKRLSRLRSLNFQALGLGGGAAWAEEPDSRLAAAVSEKLMESVAPALREKGLIVALDRLDDTWDGSRDSKLLMAGLLRAAKELNDSYGPRRKGDNGLRVVSFVRADIYDDVSFDEKDKHHSLELRIQWNEDQLRDLVARRLPEGVSVDELLDPDDMRGSIKPFSYILKRTFMRPREVLQFLEQCIEVAPTDATYISKENIRQAEVSYSKWKVEDLKQEYSKSDQSLATLLECFRQGKSRYDSLEDAEAVIVERAPQLLVPGTSARDLLERLFGYSVVGVQLAKQGSPRFKSDEPDLELPKSGRVYVHQSLHRGLSITEARSERD
jgi:hypothetical protein